MPKRFLVLMTILALLAIAGLTAGCGGGGSTATTAGSAASPLGADAKTYTNTDQGYSFKYPASWKISDQTTLDATAGAGSTSEVAVYDPKGASSNDIFLDLLMVSTYTLNVEIADSDIPSLQSEIQSMLDSLQSQATNAKVTTALAQTQLGSLKGYAVSYTFDKEGVPSTSTLYFLFKGKTEYMLNVQAATENWQKDQAVLSAMTASFAVQ